MEKERRSGKASSSEYWSRLTLAQKFAMNELNHYGYQLVFVRQEGGNLLAIAMQDDRAAVISFDGDIDLNPAIEIRK
ncbi:hypothetical protein [Flocculibacter collagenilyticus]|uniref:hypothetical protein n=1 Tax=Flocculibacter collagenilyticus TaxID=2744479 RepID=UPI0018F3DE2F|nr:hypothetical protein [Flocculibacter collagenilyticus]